MYRVRRARRRPDLPSLLGRHQSTGRRSTEALDSRAARLIREIHVHVRSEVFREVRIAHGVQDWTCSDRRDPRRDRQPNLRPIDLQWLPIRGQSRHGLAVETVCRENRQQVSRAFIRVEAPNNRRVHLANRELLAIGRTVQRLSSVRYVLSHQPTASLTGDVDWREAARANSGLVAETVDEATADQATADEDPGGGRNVIGKSGMPVAIGSVTCGTDITTGGYRSD